MRNDIASKIFRSLLVIAVDNRDWDGYGFSLVDKDLEKKLVNIDDEYELCFFRFEYLLNFYHPELKTESPFTYNSIIVKCSNYLKDKKNELV